MRSPVRRRTKSTSRRARTGASRRSSCGRRARRRRAGEEVRLRQRRMLLMVIRPRLQRMREQQQFWFAEQLAGELEGRGRPVDKSARHAERGMPGAISEQQIGADEEV